MERWQSIRVSSTPATAFDLHRRRRRSRPPAGTAQHLPQQDVANCGLWGSGLLAASTSRERSRWRPNHQRNRLPRATACRRVLRQLNNLADTTFQVRFNRWKQEYPTEPFPFCAPGSHSSTEYLPAYMTWLILCVTVINATT